MDHLSQTDGTELNLHLQATVLREALLGGLVPHWCHIGATLAPHWRHIGAPLDGHHTLMDPHGVSFRSCLMSVISPRSTRTVDVRFDFRDCTS